MFCIITYVISLLIVGSLHWADYEDVKKHKAVPMRDKVMQLYVVPFCPGLNTFVALAFIITYIERM